MDETAHCMQAKIKQARSFYLNRWLCQWLKPTATSFRFCSFGICKTKSDIFFVYLSCLCILTNNLPLGLRSQAVCGIGIKFKRVFVTRKLIKKLFLFAEHFILFHFKENFSRKFVTSFEYKIVKHFEGRKQPSFMLIPTSVTRLGYFRKILAAKSGPIIWQLWGLFEKHHLICKNSYDYFLGHFLKTLGHFLF